jgi:hypothetical protein
VAGYFETQKQRENEAENQANTSAAENKRGVIQ